MKFLLRWPGKLINTLNKIGKRYNPYDAAVNNFFIALTANRKVLINEVAQFKMPEISIK